MRLGNVDFELIYWRARRRLQRVRQEVRYRLSALRAHWLLWRMHRRAVTRNQQPEDTLLFRGILLLCFVGGIVDLLADLVIDQGGFHSVIQAGLIFSMWG